MTGRLHFAVSAAMGLFLLASGCGRQGQAQPVRGAEPARTEVAKMAWTLTSTAFKQGERIPRKYTGDREDVSPPLSWTAPPAKTVELALICDDPDAPRGTFNHWVLYALPTGTNGLPEGVPTTETLPSLGGAKQGRNSAGLLGYMGPAPPPGKVHHYHFILHALDARVQLKPGATQKDLRAAMKGHVLGQTGLVGIYSR
ncbi:MAG: YbhB/YbcL family Raf kinase inhibitor-like protein [Armatimonadota bacterium]